MRAKATIRLTAALITGLLAGLGLVMGLATPAQAHRNSVSPTVECGVQPQTWTVTWTITNQQKVLSETIIESSRPDLVPVDTEIEPEKTFVAVEELTEPADLSLEVTGKWTNGVVKVSSGTLSKDDFDLTCWDGSGGGDSITFCHQGALTTSSVAEFYDGGHLNTTEPAHQNDVFPAGSIIVDGETVDWEAYGDQDLLMTDCAASTTDCSDDSGGSVGEECVLTTPSIEVVDECGPDNDSVTLSVSDLYTGVDNGDGTATFTADPGFAFETADGQVTELTLTYALPDSAPCPVAASQVTTEPPTCKRDGTLTIPEQPAGVTVTPEPGTYGPGTYDVKFAAMSGYELKSDLSLQYTVKKAGSAKKCSPDVPDTGGEPPANNPDTPVLPDTGASSGMIAALVAGFLVIAAGLALVVRGRRLT
ncbi:MAG: LPXTG cell wall anchor domain-containing protein [Nocardioides sp.]